MPPGYFRPIRFKPIVPGHESHLPVISVTNSSHLESVITTFLRDIQKEREEKAKLEQKKSQFIRKLALEEKGIDRGNVYRSKDGQFFVKVHFAVNHEHSQTHDAVQQTSTGLAREMAFFKKNLQHSAILNATIHDDDFRYLKLPAYGRDMVACICEQRVDVGLPFAMTVMRQLLSVVEFLHENRIAHMDIKPENILIQTCGDSHTIKLIDYELCADTHKPEGSIRGTMLYADPAVFFDVSTETLKDIDVRAWDVWSCAVVAYSAMYARLLSQDMTDCFDKGKPLIPLSRLLRFLYAKHKSEIFKDFEKTWQIRIQAPEKNKKLNYFNVFSSALKLPGSRPTARELLKSLNAEPLLNAS